MNISIVKITASKHQKNLAFIDVTLNDLGLRIKGIKAISTPKGMIILLPSLASELAPRRQSQGHCYSPITFLSKDSHREFIKEVKEFVSKLLKTGDPKR